MRIGPFTFNSFNLYANNHLTSNSTPESSTRDFNVLTGIFKSSICWAPHFLLEKTIDLVSLIFQKYEANRPIPEVKNKKNQEKKNVVKTDLKNPDELRARYLTNPYEVVQQALTLLLDQPDLAKTVFVNLAIDWAKNPDRYPRYFHEQSNDSGKEITNNKHEWREHFNRLIQNCIYTKDEEILREKIRNGQLSREDSFAIFADDKNWKEEKNKSFELLKTSHFYSNIKKKQDEFEKIEKSIIEMVYRKQGRSDFIISRQEYWEEELTFGDVMVRLLYSKNLGSIADDGVFKEFIGNLHGISNTFLFIRKGSRFTKLNELVQLIHSLSDFTKQNKLREIVVEVIKKYLENRTQV